MLIPVRCISCGELLADKWEQYKAQIKFKSKKEVLDELGVKNYCCRSIFITSEDLIDQINQYKKQMV
ncbi:MAG: DNA-directed RNA polymerase subunit N [Candidatus Aenigmarchaeota archaeon]|nr:DNA-directed RNA polymerase subunit N [Candidatus Aenigmarchaeota archaeon]MCK5477087.1 DNA-directed RNA polymerase subunit N [Candidatus Aenigmarchaeota archaeon]